MNKLLIIQVLLVFILPKNLLAQKTAQKIKTMTKGTLTTTYQYDDKGRISSVNHGSGLYDVYTYGNGTIEKKTKDSTGNTVKEGYFKYELSNILVSGYSTTARSSSIKETDHYSYNEQGQLLSMQHNSGKNMTEEKRYFYDPGGRLDSIRNYVMGVLQTTEYFEYAAITNTLDHKNFGMSFLGTNGMGPLSKRTIANFINATKVSENYTYDMDGQNRIVKVVIDRGKIIETITYTYY